MPSTVFIPAITGISTSITEPTFIRGKLTSLIFIPVVEPVEEIFTLQPIPSPVPSLRTLNRILQVSLASMALLPVASSKRILFGTIFKIAGFTSFLMLRLPTLVTLCD